MLTQINELAIPEANQGIGVDKEHFYAVGQGIAWDHSDEGVLYGIIRATSAEVAQGLTHRVVVFKSNVRRRKWHQRDEERFKP